MERLLWDIITYFRTLECSKTPNIQQIGKRRYRGVKEKEFDQENGPKAEVNQESNKRKMSKKIDDIIMHRGI